MKKSMIIALALIFALSIVGTALAAAPQTFGDVPANQWSYDAVKYLAKAGIIDGYGDGTFRGDKTMTRYEMAQIVYKAMLNQDKANIAQKALIDKLASEYAMEMNKIESMDTRLGKVEANQSNVKITGRLLTQYKMKSFDNHSQPAYDNGQWQFRIMGSAQIDENTTLNLRLANPAPSYYMFHDGTANRFGDNGSGNQKTDNNMKADRFFATTKSGVTKITIGRQAMDIDTQDLIVDSGFFSFDGASVKWDWQGVKFDAKRGRFARAVNDTNAFNKRVAADFANVDIDAFKVASKTGKLDWDGGWARFSNPSNTNTGAKTLMSYAFGNVGYLFDKKFSMAAEVGKNQTAPGGNFYVISAVYGDQAIRGIGRQNFTVQYMHAQNHAIAGMYTSFDQPDEKDGASHGWNNLDLAYRYGFSKNMVGKIEYATIKDQVDATQSYKFLKAQVLYYF